MAGARWSIGGDRDGAAYTTAALLLCEYLDTSRDTFVLTTYMFAVGLAVSSGWSSWAPRRWHVACNE